MKFLGAKASSELGSIDIFSGNVTMNFKIRDLILALTSAFLGSVKGWLVSQIKSLGAIEIFGLRSIGTVCFILPIIIYWNYQLVYDLRCNVTLLFRSVIGNIAVTGYYFGFVNLPMAEASLLFYSTPIFTVIMGHVFLDERCGLKQTLSVCLSLAGVVIVCFPHFSLDSTSTSNSLLVGIVGCIIGAFSQAGALVIIRKITHVPPAVVSFWWAVVGVLFSGCFSLFGQLRLWQCGTESAFIILVALTGFICELCLVASLKSTDAVMVSIALTFEIMWAFVFQIFVNKESASSMTILGGIIIILSILLPPFFSYSCSKKKAFDVEQDVKSPK